MVRRFDTVHTYVPADPATADLVSEVVGRGGRVVVHLDRRSLEERLDAIEVLVCAEAPAIDWSRAVRLRLLQILGSGIDRLWPAEGLRPEVEIANARGIHLPEMRDHALALLFAFARELPVLIAQQRERRWSPGAAGSLVAKTVVVLGLGEVGHSVAEACGALGMRVVGIRAHPRPSPPTAEVHGPGALLDVLAIADYVVVLLPLTERTRNLIDQRALSVMRPTAVLVHLSRGGIVDEEALVDALRGGRLRGAALDVFEQEPLPASSALWSAPNLLITPHVAGRVEDYIERALAVFMDNLGLVELGMPPKTRVDRSLRY